MGREGAEREGAEREGAAKMQVTESLPSSTGFLMFLNEVLDIST